MAAEASEARLVRQTVGYQAHVLFQWLSGRRRTQIESLALPAFLTAHIDEQWDVGD